MSLTEQQQRALEHARDVLAEDAAAAQPGMAEEWRRELRMALRDVVAAFAEDTPGGES